MTLRLNKMCLIGINHLLQEQMINECKLRPKWFIKILWSCFSRVNICTHGTSGTTVSWILLCHVVRVPHSCNKSFPPSALYRTLVPQYPNLFLGFAGIPFWSRGGWGTRAFGGRRNLHKISMPSTCVSQLKLIHGLEFLPHGLTAVLRQYPISPEKDWPITVIETHWPRVHSWKKSLRSITGNNLVFFHA